MNTDSILFVIDGEEPVRHCLERALMLARLLKARLDILLWRGWSSYASNPQPWAVEEGFEYLHRLRDSLLCPGVDISTQVSLGDALVAVIAEQVRQRNSVMVVKLRRHGRSWHGATVGRELMQTCAVPLLLTDGRPWAQRTRFAAAVKLEEDSATDRNVIQTTAALHRACAASLDLVHSKRANAMSDAPEGESPAQLLLRQLGYSCHVEPQSIHVLEGKAKHTLPRFVGAMHYDLLAMGSPREQSHAFWHFSAPSLAEALMKTGCDLLVVNDDHGQLATALASGEHLTRGGGSARSAMGG